MGHQETLTPFLRELSGARDKAALLDVLERTMGHLGFRYASYHIVQLENGESRLPYILCNYPAHWVDHYVRDGFLEVDPVIQVQSGPDLPFRWRDGIDFDSLGPRQARMFREAHDAGIREGYTVPLKGRHGDYAAMTVIPEPEGAEADRLIEERAHLVQLMALYFDRWARSPLINAEMSANGRGTLLSPRETEVLQWAAYGKTSWETAAICGVSQKAVEFHTDNAKQKLGVYSKTHAVVRALTLGLISLG